MDNPPFDRALLGKIGWHYYVDGLTQKQIGERLGLSRVKVLRLLQRARAEGVVEIRIAPDVKMNTELARSLEDRLTYKKRSSPTRSMNPMSTTWSDVQAREYLERVLRDDLELGIGMGSTVFSLLSHMTPRRLSGVVIRTLAGVYEEPGMPSNSYNVAWRLADLLDATCEQIYSPLIVPDPATRDALLKDRTLRELLASVSRCEIALVGLGAIDASSPLSRLSFVPEDQLQKLRANGAAGEILGRFYTMDGQPISTRYDDRTLGISLAQLCNIPNVIAIAHGPNRCIPCWVHSVQVVSTFSLQTGGPLKPCW